MFLMMTDRIKKLRKNSLNAVNRLSVERASLITKFYSKYAAGDPSVPVHRAKAFEYFLRNKQLCILDGELIVGERGPSPKATPSYPEICLHSLEDLEILDSREKVSFKVDEETRSLYRDEIIPFWKGKTHRDRVFGAMTPAWKNAYEAGVFTEFQEQRAPGHTVLGSKIYEMGLLDLVAEIEKHSQNEELQAMKIAAEAMVMYAERNADLLGRLAAEEPDTKRKEELLHMAAVCRKVPARGDRKRLRRRVCMDGETQIIAAFLCIHHGRQMYFYVISEFNSRFAY